MITPRLRMFAGPNGSGKSTLNESLDKKLLGIYINADEIEKSIRENQYLDMSKYNIQTTSEEIKTFFSSHGLVKKANLADEITSLGFEYQKISFKNIEINSYYASLCADFIRHKLLELKVSFTFETVMSSPDKVLFLKKAQKLGYRTYLYFIATQDPYINILRVENRVKMGGHPVPEVKIKSRYYRSLNLLDEAIKNSSRAYIFDNSYENKVWLAEIVDGREVTLQTEDIPKWFDTYVLKKSKG